MSVFQKSEFREYLLRSARMPVEKLRLPPLNELSTELGVSVARLREQLEAARTLGFVEARPRTGIRLLPYSFTPAVRNSLMYAIELNPEHLEIYNNLRNHIEAAYYYQAAALLLPEDLQELNDLVNQAFEKLRGPSVQIPHTEHRRLHQVLFWRLPNPFVLGLLEAYWEAYEAAGLSQYTDYQLLRQVWAIHQKMVEALCAGDLDAGYKALLEHAGLYQGDPASAGMKTSE